MRRDTPADAPAEGAGTVLARLRGMETLEALYQVWLELKVEHAASRARYAEEERRLAHHGAFLMGAVRAAGSMPPPPSGEGDALAPRAGLDELLRDAGTKLEAARRALAERLAAEEAELTRAIIGVRERITAQVQRYLERVRPRLRLIPRPIGASRSILHVERVGGDEAVLLLYVLTGRIPSRYGFLFDDSTEDASLAPPSLYPDEGAEAGALRPGAQALRDRVWSAGPVLPIKGFLPLQVPRPEGGVDFFRLLERGPVMEAEIQEGDAFRSLLAREEAERLAGYLLRLKLEGRVELELPPG